MSRGRDMVWVDEIDCDPDTGTHLEDRELEPRRTCSQDGKGGAAVEYTLGQCFYIMDLMGCHSAEEIELELRECR